MRKFFQYFVLSIVTLGFFASCETEKEDPFPSELVKGAYFINYGVFGGDAGTISKLDYTSDQITSDYYLAQNNGLESVSNLQYACVFNDSIYVVGNAKDQLITLNPLFKQSRNGVTEGLANPRYCVGNGDYLYISCWGATPDFKTMGESYIAVFNIKENKVEKTIAMPGGPEGLAISNGNLYVAMNYIDSVSVINLTNNSVSYIATPAVSSYFVEDANNNLYVSLISTWSDFSTETGLGYINTKTNKLEKVHVLEGVSSEYGSIMATNKDKSVVYVMKTSYDENWNISGSVAAFDTKTSNYSTLISNISGPKGISVNPETNDLYLLKAESAIEGGSVTVYSPNGTAGKEYNAGLSPMMVLFLN